MSNMSWSFTIKAVGGLLVGAAAPIWCVYSLYQMSQEGTMRVANTRQKLEKSFETTLIKPAAPQEE